MSNACRLEEPSACPKPGSILRSAASATATATRCPKSSTAATSRGDPPARPLDIIRSRRIRYPRMGQLVQKAPPAQPHQPHPAHTGRIKSLCRPRNLYMAACLKPNWNNKARRGSQLSDLGGSAPPRQSGVSVLTPLDPPRRLEGSHGKGTPPHAQPLGSDGPTCILRRPRKAPEVLKMTRLLIEPNA